MARGIGANTLIRGALVLAVCFAAAASAIGFFGLRAAAQSGAAVQSLAATLEAKSGQATGAEAAELRAAVQALRKTDEEGLGEGAYTESLLVLGLGVLSLGLILLSCWSLARREQRKAGEIDGLAADLGRVFTGLAEGDLTQKVGTRTTASFEKMADDVNATVEKLAGMVTRINNSARTIADAAAEVATGGSDLSERTEHQASCLEQTAAAVEQLASTFKIYCTHAHEANTMVNDARKAGEHGVTVVASAIEAMHRIVDASEKIKGIIRVTEEISRRINMLAINAAVEAARAGEAGKGFGVVAREVGSLAGRSAQASQQIKDLITNSDTQIQQGVQMVTQSGEALQSVVGSVERAAELFNDIAISTAAQSGMLHEINITVAQMDETTQMNAALAEETFAASQSMRDECRSLKELVSFFTIDPTAGRNDLGRHIVLIESTKLDHVSFMSRIRDAIAGRRETLPANVPDHHHCRLGKWYDTIELPTVRLNTFYRALERPHSAVHAAGRRALECHLDGDEQGCQQALVEMEAASEQVLGLIDKLAANLRSHSAAERRATPPGGRFGSATRATSSAPASAPEAQSSQPVALPSRQARALPTAQKKLPPGRGNGALRHVQNPNSREWAEF